MDQGVPGLRFPQATADEVKDAASLFGSERCRLRRGPAPYGRIIVGGGVEGYRKHSLRLARLAWLGGEGGESHLRCGGAAV